MAKATPKKTDFTSIETPVVEVQFSTLTQDRMKQIPKEHKITSLSLTVVLDPSDSDHSSFISLVRSLEQSLGVDEDQSKLREHVTKEKDGTLTKTGKLTFKFTKNADSPYPVTMYDVNGEKTEVSELGGGSLVVVRGAASPYYSKTEGTKLSAFMNSIQVLKSSGSSKSVTAVPEAIRKRYGLEDSSSKQTF